MKSQARNLLAAFSTTAFLVISNHRLSTALAQGTAFTYQGQLQDSGGRANGTYDIRAGIYTNETGGTVFAGPITNSAVAVTNGLFTIPLDYGDVFDGTTYWLQIAVRTNGASAFTVLSPRQQLTPAPYSIFAEGANAAGLSGTISPGSLSGAYPGAVSFSNPSNSFTGNGAALTNVNAATLGGLSASSFWQLGGNTPPGGSQIIGTLNNQPLDLYADGLRAFRLNLHTDATGQYSNAPDIIGGSSVNLIMAGVVGGTVGGGGGMDTNGISYPNQVGADFGTVGGGVNNAASGVAATVSGGFGNIDNGIGSFIGGGGWDGATVAGNVINAGALASSIGGGLGNVVTSNGYYSFIGGGGSNYNDGVGSVIGGGGFDGFNTAGNLINAGAATIGGGLGNTIFTNGYYAVITGGAYNIVSNNFATIGGGSANVNQGNGAFIGGGFENSVGVNAAFAVIGGGSYNVAVTPGSFIGGGGYDGVTTQGNTNNANAATIGGGLGNIIPTGSRYAFIGGGVFNNASGNSATVAGGSNNTASGFAATVPGGSGNIAGGAYSFAAGRGAQALHNGSFVWNDDSGINAGDSTPNQFLALASGGFYLFTGAGSGAQLASGSSSWITISDRNAKKNFQPVDTMAVLNKLATIPIQQWNYKWEQDNDTPNIGPMAQDFKAAFYPGRDDKGISTLEFDGVELAAIQGLNQKVEAGDQKSEAGIQKSEARIQKLEAENVQLKEKNDSLEKRLEALEQIVLKQNPN